MSRILSVPKALLISVLLVAAAGLTPPSPAHAARGPSPASQSGPPNAELLEVGSGLDLPVAIASAGDGSGRLFIVEREGTIRILNGSTLLANPFLDVSALVRCCAGEQGLLGLAFDPSYETNGYFYINYSRISGGDTLVARYQVSSDPDLADPDSGQTVLAIGQPNTNHNGGQLQFGPDGYLYIGMGDGGGAGDPQNRAQNPGTLLGKMLRIDVHGGSPYAVPGDNPFVSDPSVLDEIWALGLRNPWRFSFDRQTGDLLIADVGQNGWEEIDRQPASSSGGENYGWSCYEGTHDYNVARDCSSLGSLAFPILEYSHDFGCSVTGGYRYRGGAYPELSGIYFYSDYCSGRLWGAADMDGAWETQVLLETGFPVTTFGEDEAGELYLADYAGGRIYQIVLASTFADVSSAHWAWEWIEALHSAGITAGCSTDPPRYCPDADVTRAEIAVFLKRGIHGGGYVPPDPDGSHPFSDIGGLWAEAWIEDLYDEGVAGGYPDGTYRPLDDVSRGEMAVFLLKAIHGSGYAPPPASGGSFSDVSGHWAESWIEQLKEEGISAGYPDGTYRPESPVSRAEMAVFLVRGFNLALP